MNLAQTILERLKEHLALPWPENVSPRERVVMVVYPPSEERKLRRLIQSGEFASEIKTTGHGWREHDLATEFSAWLAEHEFRDRYLARPERLWDDSGNVRGLGEYLLNKISAIASALSNNDVLALVGSGGLFGLHSVSTLIERIEDHIPGRLVVFFPGEHDAKNNSYRLLGAKDGWGYLAVPITC
jgi:hypothetical protein